MRVLTDCPAALRPLLVNFKFQSHCLIVGEPGGGCSTIAAQLRDTCRGHRVWEVDCSGPLGPVRRQLLDTPPKAPHNALLVILDNLCASDFAFQAEFLQWLYRQGQETLVVGTAKTRIFGLVRSGYFDLRLYKLLANPLLRIPPLHERPDEIMTLAYAFLRQLEEQLRVKGRSLSFSDTTSRQLFRHDWPGELGQLKRVIERAALKALSCRRNVIEPGDLSFETVNEITIDVTRTMSKQNEKPEQCLKPLKEALRNFEKEYIRQALATGGSISETCKRLGVGRTTMWRKLSDSRDSGSARILE